jgi:hypothetical protein
MKDQWRQIRSSLAWALRLLLAGVPPRAALPAQLPIPSRYFRRWVALRPPALGRASHGARRQRARPAPRLPRRLRLLRAR